MTDLPATLEVPAPLAGDLTGDVETGSGPGPTAQRQASLISLVTIVVSIVNYAYSLLLVRILPPLEYSHYASAQGLLLVLGSGGSAAVPWAVARYVVMDRSRRAAREALSFGLLAGALQGIIFGVLSLVVLDAVGGASIAVTGALGAVLLSLVAAPMGFLQGDRRLGRVAVLRLGEGVVRVATGLCLVATVSARAAWAVAAYGISSVFTLTGGLMSSRRALPLRRVSTTVSARLLASSARLGAIQVVLAVLGAADTVLVQFIHAPVQDVAGYQVASILGRVPFYLSSAVSLAFYQPLVSARDEHEASGPLAAAVRLYVLVAVPITLSTASVPIGLLRTLSPHNTPTTLHLLPWTAAAGFFIGLTNVLTTSHQARGRYRGAVRLLLPAVVVQPVVLWSAGVHSGIQTFAEVLAVLALVLAALVSLDLAASRPYSGLGVLDVALVLLLVALAGAGLHVHLLWWAGLAPGLLVIGRAVTGRRADR